jgi:hypothetical protein
MLQELPVLPVIVALQQLGAHVLPEVIVVQHVLAHGQLGVTVEGCIPRDAADGASAASWRQHIQDIVVIVIEAVVAVVVVVVGVMVVDEPLLHMSRLGPVLRAAV